MTTVATFITAMQGMTITGVKVHKDEPPSSVNKADMPMAFPLLPNGERGEAITSCTSDAKVRRMEYAILIGPVAQGTNATNYAQIATLADNLETKLDGLEKAAGGSLANFIEYTWGVQMLEVGENSWWAIVADVRIMDAK